MPRLTRLALVCLALALLLSTFACGRNSASTEVVRPWESLPAVCSTTDIAFGWNI